MLVGGRSSRMGRDKALLPFRGAPLVRWIAQAVEEAAGSVMLAGDDGRYGALGLPSIPDAYPGQGPLGGILTVLRYAPPEGNPADWNLIVACDMPGVSASFLRGLMEAAEKSGAGVLLPAGPGGRGEPLCAAYHRRALAALDTAFAEGVRSVREALKGVPTATLPVPDLEAIENVNTPLEWAAHAG